MDLAFSSRFVSGVYADCGLLSRQAAHACYPEDEQAAQSWFKRMGDGYYIRATLSLTAGRRQAAQDAVNSVTRLLGVGSIPEMILQEIGAMVTQDTLAQDAASGQ